MGCVDAVWGCSWGDVAVVAEGCGAALYLAHIHVYVCASSVHTGFQLMSSISTNEPVESELFVKTRYGLGFTRTRAHKRAKS